MRKIEKKISVFGLIKLLLFFFINSFLFIGCLSVKPSGVRSGKNLFETFYVGDKGTQYFIKPLKFKNSKGSGALYVDFTFRYKDEIKDSSFVNLTFANPNMLKNIDSLSLSNKTINVKCIDVILLFNEKSKKMFNSRFYFKTSLSELDRLFIEDEWIVKVYYNQQILNYISESKTKKRINKLRNKLFILFGN